MNSEFHRTNNNDNSNFFDHSNYDGRQNGRMNPYGNSAAHNQLASGQNAKTTQSFDPNQIYEKSSTRPASQVTYSNTQSNQDIGVTRAKDDYVKPQNNRQQNQLLSNDGKNIQANNYDQRNTNKYYSNQVKSSQEDEYFGSAANVNAQREDKQSVKQSTKPRTFTRQNFNAPVQKVTPAYTETTTFRTSTSSPIREFQHLAESAAFASSRGNNRYKPHSSNQFNSFYTNNKPSTPAADTLQQSTATTTVSTLKDKSSPQSFVRSRIGIPAFPGPTFTPIYKPRTTTLSPAEAPTTTQRFTNTDYYRQGSQEQTTTYGNYETTTLYPEYTTRDSQFTYTTTSYRDRNTHPIQTTFNSERYTATEPTTQRVYYNKDFYRETTTPSVTSTISYDSGESTTRFTDNYSGSYTTTRPVYNEAFSRNTVSSNTVDDNGATTPAITFVDDIQAQDSARFGLPKFSTKSSSKTESQAYRQNVISASTEKSKQFNENYDGIPRRTPSPYDKSVTYQHGKIMSTLGPYVPFTKNYAFTTSTTPKTSFVTASSNYIQSSKNIVANAKSQNFVASNFIKSGTRATYLPEKTTQPSFVSDRNSLDNRPANEREHALEMLKSLQGLEGTVPDLNLNNINNNTRNGLDIPTSSGPSTLHSLALYFANADDVEDSDKPTDSAVNVQYFETTPNPIEKKNTSVIEFPSSILTQHTISSYAELFNLNNALENNITGDTSYDNSDENLTDEDTSDLDIQQSEGPLSGVKKSNNTKLRELAQVFTQALSAYLQDPDTFKKVLTEIRPTEPPTSENEITTASPTTTEDYPSVTKEKDEVLDFSDDNNGVRRRRPTTTPFPETTKEPFDSLRETTTYQPYYTREFFTTTTPYPDESLNEAQSGYIHDINGKKTEDKFAYQVNNIFDSKKINEVQNYKSTTYSVSSSSNSGKDYENYFPNEPSRYGGFQNNSASTHAPYGKYVKPSNATPISDNYVASSTPATYEVAAPHNFVSNKPVTNSNENLRDDLTPPAFPNYSTSNTLSSASASTIDTKTSNAGTSGSSVTPVYKRPQEAVTTTKEPFRIRYYDTPTTKQQQQPESLVTANSAHPNYGNNYNNIDNGFQQTDKPSTNQRYTNSPTTYHWTSSPTVTQLWETTVFIDPEHINRGLDNDPKITQSSNFDYRSTTPSSKSDFVSESNNGITQNFVNDPSTPWQWAPNNNDAPTAFTLLPNIYANTENTATPTPTYTTRSSITTTITSSITATNTIPPRDSSFPTRISVYNVTENEIQKAQQMFGNLNETSTNTLMKVMKQADNNTTVRQLVLLLISHCNGPMNKTMEEEKEQLLNALLRMPVNEFTSEESRDLIRGISKLHLPIGKSASESRNPAPSITITTPTTTAQSAPHEPLVTTFRSRSGRKFKTTTAKSSPSYSKVASNNIVERSDRISASESRGTVALEEGTASDNRALDLLRSLYSIAAKWG